MDLGDAKYTVTLVDKATDKMKSIEGSMGSLKKNMLQVAVAMAAAAGAVTAALGKMTVDWATTGDALMKMSQRTGWSVESLSKLDYVAKQSGTSLDAIEVSTKKLSKAIIDASDGMATYTRDFDRLGLSLDDIRKMSIEEQFWTVAYALAAVEDVTERTALATELFGRSGTDLLPMLANGVQGVEELSARYHELAYQWTTETAGAAVDLHDKFADVKTALGAVGDEIAVQLGPHITEFIENQLLPAIRDFGDFIRENEQLTNAFIGLAAAAVTFANGLVAVVAAMVELWDAIPDWFPAKMLLSGNFGSWLAEQTGRTAQAPGLLPGIEEAFGSQASSALASTVSQSSVGGSVTINVGNMMGDDASIRKLALEVESAIMENDRRTSFPHVNTGYFGGSIAP